MKQRDLEALAARCFAAPEADEALIAEESAHVRHAAGGMAGDARGNGGLSRLASA